MITAQVNTTQEFCTRSATVAAFSLPVLMMIILIMMMMKKMMVLLLMMMVVLTTRKPVNEVANPGTKDKNSNGARQTVHRNQLEAVRLELGIS